MQNREITYRIYLLLSLLLSLGLTSCLERIDFETNYQESQLVIYGQLNNLDEDQYIQISRTSDGSNLFTTTPEGFVVFNDLPEPVQNASAWLVDSDGQKIGYVQRSEGKYFLSQKPNLEDLQNKSYHLEILVDGKTIKSDPQTMPNQIGIDSSYYTFGRGLFGTNPSVPLLSVHTRTTIPSDAQELYLRWDLSSIYIWNLTFFPNPFNQPPPLCFVIEDVDTRRIVNLDASKLAGTEVNQILGVRRIDRAFLSRHYIIVKQLSITNEAFTYWNQIQILSENTGSLFDVPPAPIRGNLANENDPDEVVLGFFEVARASETNFFTVRGYFPYLLEDECNYIQGTSPSDYPPECLSCSFFPNSTGEIPSIFR